MRPKLNWTLWLILLAVAGPLPASAENEAFLFSKESRVLIIAPHPDDETLATGGVIQSVMERGGDVKIVYVTHGDYNEIASMFYQKKPLLSRSDFILSGQIRSKEAIDAMATLHLAQKNLIFLGYPDFGTLNIWRHHWGEAKPFRSFITRINKVPYKGDFSYGRPYRGENIVSDLEKILVLYRPTHIFVAAPFDLNADHQAAYLYLQVALLNLQDRIDVPKVLVYLVHAHRWPSPRKFRPEVALEPPPPIPGNEDVKWNRFQLSAPQIELKRKALLKYKSQIAYSRELMLSFARTNELFLELPYVDLKLRDPDEAIQRISEEKGPPDNKVTYWVSENELWVDIHVINPLDELGTLHMEIFSYRTGEDFLAMPKLNLVLVGNQVWVRDGRKRLPGSGIRYDLKKKSFLVRIPLKLLKDPDHLFVSTQTIKNDISLDFGSWRILRLPH